MQTDRLRVGSVCSGIGGLDLGVEWAGAGDVVWFCEIEEACQVILNRHWPDAPTYPDVKTLLDDDPEPIDILTGGYPCQPFSLAGQRGGESDPRHLWPYVHDAVRHLRPRIVLLENVPGHLSLGFGRVLGDLAESGYDALWVSVRASDVGAPHGRDRVFIVATSAPDAVDIGRSSPQVEADGVLAGPSGNAALGQPREVLRSGVRPPADSSSPRLEVGEGERRSLRGQRSTPERGDDSARREEAPDSPSLGQRAERDEADAVAGGRQARKAPGDRAGGVGPRAGEEASNAESEVIGSGLRLAGSRRGRRRPRDGAGSAEGEAPDSPGDGPGPGGSGGSPGSAQGLPEQEGSVPFAWGPFESVIRIWESVLGRPHPLPVEPGTGAHTAEFVEWMMGFPEGWTDGLSRAEALTALGNAVVPQVAELIARTFLLST